MPERTGDWMQTYTKRHFYPMDPRADEFDIEDIAHSLSQICRFGGHTREFYSVAQHCVMVSHLTGPLHALAGLLHDAAEAYVGDMVRPLKYQAEMASYRLAEKRILSELGEWAGVRLHPLSWKVAVADDKALATEARDLMSVVPGEWADSLPPPVVMRIEPLAPLDAERVFMERYHELAAVTRGQ